MNAFVTAALFGTSTLALYVPGGSVNAFANGNQIQAFWGPNGYSTTSTGPGFSSHMSGQFGAHGGSISNSISQAQVFPGPFHVARPFF
ncbi:hypothetical protein IWW55_001297 [Coemansia sp. RSA 2706]|nr:hypothetical protein LPJ63_000184 [Coemansia sp. RSA 2711]KAJ2306764.1 hypothetical protein IWW55_001297 [Coemansia sp. RSA 2706]KAJ2320012.1 hypothetical protein IWW52_001629 [Coemansia sp. RSA 2704]KAJ2387812.1 hypothetical protein H4S02_003179 [Coemansia sp. RSA 2611]KAJ2737934.1 hypothetical protein H4R23_001502 [Coemansia sp. Cherry 401B]